MIEWMTASLMPSSLWSAISSSWMLDYLEPLQPRYF
jgi:hypothetical protein